MKKKSLALGWIAVLSSSALAHEINLGYVTYTEIVREEPKISLLHQGDQIKVRFKIFYQDEVKCSKYRPDFCGIEDKVDMIEISAPSSSCNIEKETLLRCEVDSWGKDGQSHVIAILKDKTIKKISSAQTTLNVGELKTLDYDQTGRNIIPVSSVFLSFELLGNRADGLDPLVEFETRISVWNNQRLQVVKKSLFK